MISDNRKVICPGFRLRSLSYGGQAANRLRPKPDFGGSRGYAGRSRRVDLSHPAFVIHGFGRVAVVANGARYAGKL